jgi:hypothetical protein
MAATNDQPTPEFHKRLRFDGRRILQGGIRCVRCDKFLSMSPDLSNAEALEELRDEGWAELPGGWFCNECAPE